MEFLFDDPEEEEKASALSVEVSDSITVQLHIAKEDFNQAKKSLFATYLWSASSVLAKKLVDLQNVVQNKLVLEFGAGAGLPSITAVKLGAAKVCACDFPAPTVLDTLRRNIRENDVDITVVPHIWGEDVTPLLEVIDNRKYDIILASECVWKPDAHIDLFKSVKECINTGGFLMLSYAHHIPTLQGEYDQFIDYCEQAGFKRLESSPVPGKHMWNDSIVDIYFHMLQYTPNAEQ
eukprot:TRINITY_DN1965_c0_g1_i1.p1 TRINITY_DN1965_c0_g1~~TRINITY_DN1965_c0_g1_i1.p1  ORF type:complete len:235 (-),score=41.86 TRINITY_DN1965_c0_g1_i1:143-847(-)